MRYTKDDDPYNWIQRVIMKNGREAGNLVALILSMAIWWSAIFFIFKTLPEKILRNPYFTAWVIGGIAFSFLLTWIVLLYLAKRVDEKLVLRPKSLYGGKRLFMRVSPEGEVLEVGTEIWKQRSGTVYRVWFPTDRDTNFVHTIERTVGKVHTHVAIGLTYDLKDPFLSQEVYDLIVKGEFDTIGELMRARMREAVTEDVVGRLLTDYAHGKCDEAALIIIARTAYKRFASGFSNLVNPKLKIVVGRSHFEVQCSV